MNYVVFDLEWNNAYNYKTRSGMNEIIEIGAIMLDEQLNIVDSFKQLIKPKMSKRLTGRFKELTHITTEEIKQNGIDFSVAFRDFARWSDPKNSVFLSWSDSDLYVLVSNFNEFEGVNSIPFIQKYVDAQKYCMHFLPPEMSGNQISLAHCAEEFKISVEEDNLHRALEDCYVTAKCLQKVFDREVFDTFVRDCTGDYFPRLVYKSHYIKTPVTEDFNINEVEFLCPKCASRLETSKSFDFSNNAFRNVAFCKSCRKKFFIQARAKQTYDGVQISKKIMLFKKKSNQQKNKNIKSQK